MTGFSFVLATILFAYVVLAEPVMGVRLYRKLMEVLRVDSTARVRFYRQTIVHEWVRVIIVAGILILSNMSFSKIGVGLPLVRSLGFIIGITIGGVAAIISFLRAIKKPIYRENVGRAMGSIAALLPRTANERRLWAAISITAGICEEILFRGFLMLYLSQVLPILSVFAIAIISSIIFGLAHAYQGWKGVVGTSMLGFGLAVIYVVTGSLIPSMIIHALVDIRVLLVWNPQNMPGEVSLDRAM